MNQKQLVKPALLLAELVGLIGPASRSDDLHGAIMRFAEVVAEAEREECAKEAERHSTYKNDTPNSIAKSIRARQSKDTA